MGVGFSYATQDEGRDMKLQRLADNFMKLQG